MAATIERTRHAHVESLLELAGGRMRVQTRNDHRPTGGNGAWFTIQDPSSWYHLREVLPHEFVLDVGDDVAPGEPRPWPQTAAWANALAEACVLLEVPTWWLALSAGKGIHLHVFGHSLFEASLDHAEAPQARAFEARVAPPKPKALADAPPCIRAIHKALSEGARVPHEGRLAIAAYFHHAGFASEDLVGLFCRAPNFNEAKTRDQVRSIATSHLAPPNCTRLQAAGLCHDAMRAPRCRSVRNPISFLPRTTPREDGDGAFHRDEAPRTASDWRWPVANHIIEVASTLCGDPALCVDWRLVAPSAGGRMCREFGAQKDKDSPRRKVLWHDSRSGAPFTPVPADRDEAYRMAQSRALGWPSPPMPGDLTHLDLRWAEGCPKSPACLTSPSFCQGCPAVR